MKKWLVGASLIAAIGLSIPYGFGMLTQKGLALRQAEINQHLNNDLALEIVQYQRGWFHSTAQLKLSLHAKRFSDDLLKVLTPLLTPQGAQNPDYFSVIMNVQITHGPFIFHKSNARLQMGVASLSGDCDLPWNEQVRQKVLSLIGQQSLCHIDSLVHFTGTTTSHVYSAKLNYANQQDDLKLVWNGLHLQTEMNKDLDHVALNLEVSPMSASNFSGSTKMDSSNIALIANLRRGIEDLWFGNVDIAMNSLNIILNNKPSFVAEHINAVSQQSVQNQKVSTTLKYTIEHIVANNQQFGPSVFTLALNQLSAPHLKIVSDIINKNNLQTMTKEQLVFFGMQMVPDFLRMVDGASMQMSFNTQAPEGLVNVNLAVSAPKQTGKHIDPLSIARETQGSLQIVAPKNIVIGLMADRMKEQVVQEALQKAVTKGVVPDAELIATNAKLKAQNKLHALVGDGWLMESQGDFKTDYHYQDGRIIANGVTKFDFLNPNANQTKTVK
ncbi:MAG: YdgA family protein [Pseudomonadota bacterium]|nr:YdgA family protein [Pseudomonadota bacterium]